MLNQLKLAEHISLTELDDEVVLLDLNSGAYYGLNHIGAQIMSALEKGLSNETTVAKIASRYQVSHQQIQEDMDSLLSDMLNNKLLVEIDKR